MPNRINIKRKKVLPRNAKKVFSGVIFDVYQWQQKMFDGSFETFEMLKRPDTVAVIPTTSDCKIILEVNDQPHRKKFYSFPGGAVENQKNVDLEALRELKEETGYVPEKMKLWKTVKAGSKFDWFVYFFIAQKCKKKAKIKNDPGEKVNVKLVSLDELLELIIKQKFNAHDLTIEFIKAYYDKKQKEKLRKLLFE
jgi:ADP-ribose pyrophosphatase